MKKVFNNIKLYIKKQNQIIKENKLEIEKTNRKLIFSIILISILILILFMFVALVFHTFNSMLPAYIAFCIFLTLFLLTFKIINKVIPTVYLLYVLFGFFVLYVTYTSAVVTPDFACVLILLVLFQIPLVTIDKGLRVNLITIAYTIFYMIIAIQCKDSRIMIDEIFNCLLFVIFGIALGESLRQAKLNNLDLKRQAVIREMTDDLTALENRKSLFKYLNEIENIQSIVGIFMIDIDYFKLYNDTYGHQGGDLCLSKIGECYKKFGDEYNIKFYRYGGEEFVAVALNYNSDKLLNICKMLNKRVMELNIQHIASEKSIVTISIGLSTSTELTANETSHNWDTLLSQADIAMYQAKTRGKNNAVKYSDNMEI